MGENETYTMITLGGNPVGGILDMDERGVPAEIPAHWLVYFATEDTDATVAQAKERGGQRDDGADRPPGRPLRDPHRPARRRLRGDRSQRERAAGERRH